MAKRRTSIIRIATESVQGEDSWATIRKLTVSEQREFQKMAKDKSVTAFEMGLALMRTHVVHWDWVDDDDTPLPQPIEDPSVIERLTDAEVTILGDAIRGLSDGALKNSKSKSPESSG